MTRTRTKAIAALAAMALATAGCGGTGDDGSDGTTTVTFWHAYNETGPEVKTLTKTVIPALEKKHPDITVKQVAFPYDNLRQKLLGAAAGGELPCLVRSDIIWVPELAKLGVLTPLDEQMDDFDAIADRTFPGPLATNKYRGKHYGLPLDTNTRVLMYNQEVLADAGVKQPPASFDDLRALADKLKGSKRAVFADNATDGWNLLPWIWSAGGQMLSPKLDKATGHLNSDQSVAAIQLLIDLKRDGQLPDLILGGKGGIPTEQGLAKGKYATILDGPWMFPIYAEQFPDFDLKTAPMPAGPGGSVSVVGGEDIVMTQSCQDKDAAAEVIRHMLSDTVQLEMAKVGQMPVLSDLGAKLTSIEPYYGVFAEQLKTARPRPPVPHYNKIEDILSRHVADALRGKTSARQALNAAAKEIDAALAQG